MTAEPLVVMASNPAFCSSTVQYLTTLIYPLNYAADYRPFYTIHDSDFKVILLFSVSADFQHLIYNLKYDLRDYITTF